MAVDGGARNLDDVEVAAMQASIGGRARRHYFRPGGNAKSGNRG